MSGKSIEAVLTLDASGFTGGMDSAIKQVESFQSAVNTFGNSGRAFATALDSMVTQLNDANLSFSKFESQVKGVESFNKFANGVKALATAIQTLGTDSATASVGITKVIKIVESMSNLFGSSTIKVEGLNTAIRQLIQQENALSNSTKQTDGAFKKAQQDLMSMVTGLHRYGSVMSDVEAQSRYNAKQMKEHYKSVQEQIKMMSSEFEKAKSEMLSFANTGVEAFNRIGRSVSTVATQTNMLRLPNNSTNLLDSNSKIIQSTELIKQNSIAMQQNGAEKLRNMGYTGKLSVEEEQLSQKTQKQTVATDRATQSMNRQATATSRLSRAMSSLKMIGTMVASMMVWNFASSLVNATRETVNAKSEMEGYFQMLHFSDSQIDQFNKSLDQTVSRFQRINKYSLGETISSIGVEFNLTTKEMEKAMPVVSMITSEYLRAGRNPNEASLAVKDILQGEFQRLSRETGVKGDQLKEAGWSGDKKDVMGLLEALDKVGKSRNWDVFVTKANSLNDAVLILQNRFGEWSADMVNVVQPTILSVFNSLMSFGEGLSQSLSSAWEWLNGGSWEATATQIGLIGGAILTVSQALVMYRTGMGLAQTSQLGFTKSLASIVLGLKGQELAEIGVRNAILSKIMGVKGETIAQKGLLFAMKESTIMTKLQTVEEKINTASKGENSVASKLNALQQKLNKAETEGLILAKDKETIQEEINTIAKEGNTLETIKQGIANEGLIATLFALGTEEAIITEETGALTIAWGVLNGVFALSPIGWITTAILGLAGAFYVLTGGLDKTWGEMKEFNETMKDAGSVQNEAHKWLQQYTEDHKDNEEAVSKANKTYDDYIHKLQSASYWYNHSQTEFNGLDLTAETTGKDVLEDYGISKKDAEEWVANTGVLVTGKQKYYYAEQVLNKQIKGENSEYAKDLKEYLGDVEKTGGDLEGAYDTMTKNYENLAYHSYVANTSDDWWESGWNYLYYKMDKFWIDWDKFWADASNKFQVGDIVGILFGDDVSAQTTKDIENLVKWFEDGWKSLSDALDGWQKGAVEFLEPLNSIGDEFNKFTQDPLGYIGLQGHLDNVWKEIVEPLVKGVTEDLPNYISESLGHWGEIFDSIKKPILDAWNNFISFDWLPSFDFDIWSLLGMDTVSASDGSDSEHPSFMEDISNIIGFDVQSWIDSFNADPMGTLGIELPKIDILGLIKGLLPTGENGESFNMGDFLGNLFNLDGVISFFNTGLTTIISSASSTASTVTATFNGLKTNIQTHLTNIVTNVQTGFENAKNYAVTKITGMRDSVSGVIHQMTDAWKKMKDSILDSAKLIYDGVKKKFDDVKTTLSDFFTKLQNPSQWGSGFQPYSRQPQPLKVRRMLGGNNLHGAGVNPYARTSNKKMSIRDLVDMVGVDEQVNIEQFLALFSGGFGGWSFHEPSKKEVFNKGKEWKTAPPSIQGVGSVGDGYKVARFWDGKPSFTFSEFEQVAQAIFSTIPYKFYYDSEWKGDWVSAFLSGAVNCWDGANALIALAKLFGFDGYPVHTTTKSGVGHFYAMINGKAMDTTNFQHNRSWSPLGGAGIPTRSSSPSYRPNAPSNNTEVNITINGDVYGEEDFMSRIRDGAREVMREEFNDPLSGVI